MPNQKRLVTKSSYVQGLTCDRFFWFYQNQRDKLPEPDANTQAIFDQGHQIGDLAKTLYPVGWLYLDKVWVYRYFQRRSDPLPSCSNKGDNRSSRCH